MPPLTHIKERRVLTLYGWGVVLAAAAAVLVTAVLNIHPFLATTQPVQGGVLVVEGWLPDYALEEAMKTFNEGDYRLLITAGSPLSHGTHLSEHKTWAHVASATLKSMGMDPNQVVPVPARYVPRDRTHQSARVVKEFLNNLEFPVSSVDVVSLGAHSRRSWILYKAELEPEFQVGIITIANQWYDPDRWWLESAGVRDIISEVVAYCYVRLVFLW